MNLLELIILVVSIIFLLFYFKLHLHSLKQAVLITLLLIIPIYLSLETTTQFLTIDEIGTGMILEPSLMILPSAKLSTWTYALRTTDLLLGGIFYIILHTFVVSLPFLKMLTKAAHWFFGFLFILGIHNLLSSHFISGKNRFIFSIIFLYTALLLPTNVLALKVFNYDLLSMLLSVIALLYLLSAIKDKKYSSALIGIIISVLAAQEKFIVSPIFILSSIVFCCLISVDNKKRYAVAMFASIFALEIGILISFITFAIVGLMRNFNLPDINLFSISFPLTAWTSPLIILITATYPHLFIRTCPLFFIICSIYVIFFVCISVFTLKNVYMRLLRFLKNFNSIFCWLVFVIGVISTYLIKLYIAPYRPIEKGFYHTNIPPFNNAIWHFGTITKTGHILSFVAYSISVFVNAIPSVFWLVLLILFYYQIKDKKNENNSVFLGWEALLLLSLLMPVVFGIAQVPVINRYFNVAIFLFAIVILIKFENFLKNTSSWIKPVITAIFITLLILETFPFKPLYGPFRPIWSNYSKEYSQQPVLGQLNGSWPGWGEEVMLAGKEIEKIIKNKNINSSDVRLYSNYYGEWIGSKMACIYPVSRNSRYTESDYYILNRIGIAQNHSAFPYSVTPLFTLEFRNFVQAWVFRGDQLKKANFEFK